MVKGDPLSLENAGELDTLISSPGNSVILFYMNGCPHCEKLFPIYTKLARNIQNSNYYPGAVPIIVAGIDGVTHLAAINELRPGFLGQPPHNRGFPTILFKKDGEGSVWDTSIPRTEYNLLKKMAEFFQDPTLNPIDTPLYEIMNDKNPEFYYFYNDTDVLVPRFAGPIDPDFVDLLKANDAITYQFLIDPNLRQGGAAFPVNKIDRLDIAVPSIYDVATGESYDYRDAAKWVLNRKSQVNKSNPAASTRRRSSTTRRQPQYK